jgi:hypothetical protein
MEINNLFIPESPKNCPFCNCIVFYKINSFNRRNLFKCRRCRRMFTPVSRTCFARTKLTVVKLNMAIRVYAESRGRISSMELKRLLGTTYGPALALKNKLKIYFKCKNVTDNAPAAAVV